MLPKTFSNYSIFSFSGGGKHIFVEGTGVDFKSELSSHLEELKEGQKPLNIAIDLGVLKPEFLHSQELVRQLDKAKRQLDKLGGEIILVGKKQLEDISGLMWNRAEFQVIDFEPIPPVGY
ncbi:hypothetical protein COX09_05255 [Candidatus Beckwithbacteria bacterium CG23_combo_of_CG06-09_8_20_14_all_47_9]|uniref:Uncharacterized protein n=1 Tax=Candidatus Beckwithbacteria bacterium CG23_combo_of_CG06-09_8_20_14_all_47_9 TaxID=1974498 RepID=A0A2H0B286_9BACT|nr:MAG: hypothetical protein COX09_05255 [Candidatus Beckwithbacteria bacterium CG23_combo_of_CG06-09_8_20_14_all_47_9]